eukprot:2004242-Pyramimonas_sp.AAC.1
MGAKPYAISYDVDPSLKSIVESVHSTGRGGVCNVGPVAGDITGIIARSIPDVDLIVAGPPCPPWSRTGAGQSG